MVYLNTLSKSQREKALYRLAMLYRILSRAMNKFNIIGFCILTFGLVICCNGQSSVRIKKKILSSPNSTSHIFQFPRNILKDALATLFRSTQWRSPDLKQVFSHYSDGYSMHVEFRAVYAKDNTYYEKPKTENEIFLDSYLSAWDSPLYYFKGKPLPYITSFSLKLDSMDNERTLIIVKAIHPEIFICPFYWEQCSTCSVDVMDLRTRKVKPTIIEEHTLLLFIADMLGDKTVEPLKLPETRLT